MSARLVNNGSGGTRSRTFYARFKDVDDKAQEFIFEDAKGNEIRVGPDYQMEKQKREGNVTLAPSQVALRRFGSSTSERHLDVITTEQPWVRIVGQRSNGTCYDLKKVSTRYSKEVGEARSDEARALARKKTQDARRCVTGLGRGRVFEMQDGRITASVDFIPDGRGPENAETFGGEAVYDQIKAMYRANHKAGMRQNFTFSSGPIDGERYGVAPIMAPTIEAEEQPNPNYTVKRPLTPEEFDKYVDEVADGMMSANDKFAAVLSRVAEVSGEWKLVGGYSLRFSWNVTKSFDDRKQPEQGASKRPGKSISDDVHIGRALRSEGQVAIDKWRSPMTTLRSYAGTTITGRAGVLHDGFVPMSLMLSRDSFTKHVCVDDATMNSAPAFPCEALVADPESMEDWHQGRTREIEPSLEMLVPPRARNSAQAEQAAQAEAQANGPAAEDLVGAEESAVEVATPADAWNAQGLEAESGEAEVPF